MHNLLRFPEAPSPSAAYGDAIHKTLQWLYLERRKRARLPSLLKTQHYFSDLLSRKPLRPTEYKKLADRGQKALADYLKHRGQAIEPKDLIERGFNNEGVVIGGAALSGKLDKLHFLEPGLVQVVDFKTGRPAASWQGKDEFEKIKLHKYRQQLLFYKLLVENSASFKNKLVATSGALEFIEPNEHGQLVSNLELTYNEAELQTLSRLIVAVWDHVMKLVWPDVQSYPKTIKGIQQFEQDLVEGNI